MFTIRPVTDHDLPDVLAVQQACYGTAFLEPADALASRWARSPALCLAATLNVEVVGYLLSHTWPAGSLPTLHVPLPVPAGKQADNIWFIHDMAIAPAGRGQGLGERLYASACLAAQAQGLRQSRLVAVQGADGFWRRLGYRAASTEAAPEQALRAIYGEAAQLMERALHTTPDSRAS